MKFTIKNIILFPKDAAKSPRVIDFAENKINVITGNSHRGKSAIIHIIDYCLGSDKCTIPVDKIRNSVHMFGLLIQTENSEIFVAREEPGDQITTHEMYLYERFSPINVHLLTNLNKRRDRFARIKVNRKTVINRFNNIAGFSTQKFENDDQRNNNWLDAASFRDTTAFQFQPQNIIANPNTLLFKADTYEHQNKLRTIFPLLLGYENNELIELRKQKKDFEDQISKRERQLQEKILAKDVWKNDALAHYTKAIDLGLTAGTLQYNDSTVANIVSELERIVQRINESPIPLHQKGSGSKYADQLSALFAERNHLSSKIDQFKFKLSKIQQVNFSKKDFYTSVVTTKKERLRPLDFFIQSRSVKTCPFCESENNKAVNQLLQLQNAAFSINAISNEVNLDKEIRILNEDINSEEDKLNRINQLINSIYLEEENENSDRNQVEKIYRFIGQIEEAITNMHKSSLESELAAEIQILKSKLAVLIEKIQNISNRLNESVVMKKITSYISRYTELLDIERPNDPVKLDIQNLTLKISNPNRKREDFLWEIGSGANHMGYHLAFILGIHEYFLELPRLSAINYVPSFLIIDQPSQVYFPKAIPETLLQENMQSNEQLQYGEDVLNTMKIFKACEEFIKRTKGATQIIILEHAPAIMWQGLHHINFVEEWRDEHNVENNALIPKSW